MKAFLYKGIFTRLFSRFGFHWILYPCLWAFTHSSVALETIEDIDSIRLPNDFSQLHFYLLTVNVGSMVWDKFGHTALRIVDEDAGTDVVLNWGVFDFSDPVAFSLNFFRGITNFQLGLMPTEQFYTMYTFQRRTLWQNEINLTSRQKEKLYQRVSWNLRAENIVYSYQYFFDNCTTRVRDYIDEAVGGKVASGTRPLTEYSYRDMVQSHYATMPIVAGSLDVLMNGDIDRTMTQWEEMFLPLGLQSTLLKLPSDVTVNGRTVSLLGETELMFEFTPPVVKFSVWLYVFLGLIAPLVMLCFFLKKMSLSALSHPSGLIFKWPGFSYRVLAIVGILISIFSGVFGIIMISSWVFSGQTDLHHNINLLLFWPTDLLGVVISMRWFLFTKPWSISSRLYAGLRYYLLVHMVGLLLYLANFLLALSNQETGSLLLFVGPGLLLFTLLVWIAGFTEQRSAKITN